MAVLASIVLGSTLAACGDSTGPTSPVGSFALTTVGTKAPPAVIYDEEGYSLSVTAGEMSLKADSTYSASLSVTEVVDGNRSDYVDREAGRWEQGAAGAITFKPTGAQTYGAVWSGNTLNVAQLELSLLYTRK